MVRIARRRRGGAPRRERARGGRTRRGRSVREAHGWAAEPLVLLVSDAGGTHKEAVAWGDALTDRAAHTLAGAAN